MPVNRVGRHVLRPRSVETEKDSEDFHVQSKPNRNGVDAEDNDDGDVEGGEMAQEKDGDAEEDEGDAHVYSVHETISPQPMNKILIRALTAMEVFLQARGFMQAVEDEANDLEIEGENRCMYLSRP